MTKPITPKEAFASTKNFPPEVIEVWNDLIVKNRSGRQSTVKQNDAVEALCAKMGVERSKVFDNGWLEIEGVFGKAGWSVKYDKPDYTESWGAYFTFRVK